MVKLKDLFPGCIFKTRSGIEAFKTEYRTFNKGTQCDCYLLASGEAVHFPDEEEIVGVGEVYFTQPIKVVFYQDEEAPRALKCRIDANGR